MTAPVHNAISTPPNATTSLNANLESPKQGKANPGKPKTRQPKYFETELGHTKTLYR